MDQALERLRKFDARLAEIVDLRYFADLTIAETAEVMNLSCDTIKKEWATARAWLQSQLLERGT